MNFDDEKNEFLFYEVQYLINFVLFCVWCSVVWWCVFYFFQVLFEALLSCWVSEFKRYVDARVPISQKSKSGQSYSHPLGLRRGEAINRSPARTRQCLALSSKRRRETPLKLSNI